MSIAAPATTPDDENQLVEAVADAAARTVPLAVAGGATRLGLGRPMQTAESLSTANLTGITLYEPAELVISARAGTPLAEIETALAAQNQRLGFEPVDHRRLFGSQGTPTIGAIAAANVSGPRRIQVGAARDSLIGLRAVTGAGALIKSGGRVMKNVTGYDLVKFLAGSYGTLSVLSEVTFKVQPSPETEVTLVLNGLDDDRAVEALSAALGSPFSVTGAAHLPAGDGDVSRTLIRLEGFAESVAERTKDLIALLAAYGAPETLDAEATRTLWRAVGDLEALGASDHAAVWKVSVKPSDGPAIAAAARAAFASRVLYDWGGGLVWIATETGGFDAGAAVIRDAIAPLGGHATLVKASDAVRLATDVFQPLAPPLMDLTRKLKARFDPAGILNPGRMYAGV
ncbi:glycolate oxidase subunit GlcE [Bauldia litoralis]|uniref:glycolate oxidase subunit GlcE n=2 Tax=Bauldia litoralis TaxID=665467 RepID=UPI003297DC76